MPDDTLGSTSLEDRFERVLADLLQAEERGERLNLSQAIRGAPELETPLREFFHNRDGFDQLAPQLAPVAGRPARAAPQPDLPPGSRFAGYEVIRELGHGGRGIVYRVGDPELNRPLAVKVLRTELRDEPDAVRRFLEEAQVTGQLQHPSIVPVHAIGQLPDGRPYFSMKLVQGRTLAGLLAERPTPAHDLPRFLGIFQQVCQAVAFAHSRRVIHRDLKPANIMVGAFAEVQVMDWGLAKVLTTEGADRGPPQGEPGVLAPGTPDTIRTVRTEATGLSSADGLVVGTFAYMSPEQAKGRVEQLDPRADVFGLGALLCEVLTGLPPYAGVPPWELHLMAAAGDLADAFARLDRCGADPELTTVARDCLSPEREHRPGDAGAVAERVAAYLAGVQERLRRAELEKAAAQVRAEEAQATIRAERRARWLTAGLATAGLVVVVVLAAGGLWAQRQRAVRQAEAARQAEALRLEVGAALGQAARFRLAGHFEECRELLEQARQRAGTNGPDDLRKQVDQALADTGLVERLDHARQRALAVVKGEKLDFAGPGQEYAVALSGAGLGREEEDPEAVAARVRASAVRVEIVATLDDWAVTAGEGQLTWLLAVARAADPDPERNRLRQPALWRDAGALARLAEEARVEELSPQLATALARVLRRRGRDPVPLLREAQAHYPHDFWLNFRLGVALHQAKQWDEAIGYYLAALALRPRAAVVRTNLGVALYDRGKWDEAVRHYQQALRIDPKDWVVHNNLGSALYDRGKWEEAVGHFEQALRIDPKNAKVHSNLGNALKAKGRVKEAVGHYEEALRIDPKCAPAHNNLGATLYDRGKWEEAVAHYEEALGIDPLYADAHYNLGNALHDRGKWEEAVRHYQQALRIDPQNARVHNNLGNALYAKGRVEEAVGHYEEALRIDPKHANAHIGLGNALRARGKLGAAIEHYERAVRIDPTYAGARYNLGNALYEKGRLDEAVGHLRQALHLDAKLAPAHVCLGRALEDKGRLEEAVGHYEEALRIDPECINAHINLGVTLYDRGKWEEAVDHYQQALRIDPQNAIAHSNLGNALRAMGRVEEAVGHYEEALRIDPKLANAHLGLGNALKARGKLGEAVDHYEQALRLDPKLAQAHGALGLALLALGRWSEARDATRRCLDLLPQRHPLRAIVLQQLQRCERMAALEAGLPSVPRGQDKTAGPAEWLELARVCRLKKRYAAAAHLYAEAFAADPKPADDLRAGHRYDAARCAVLAAAAEGADDAKPDDRERTRLRGQALDWLRADLALWKKQAQPGQAEGRVTAERVLQHWQADSDLAGVRDEAGLAKLPDKERQAWEKLWAEVEALRQRTHTTR
jgi:tetratricopeptide (TPR) repeat protein